VTVRHVLTHTSGLERQPGGGDDWIERTIGGRIVAEPGSQFSYSNTVPDLLSEVITRRSGMRTAEFATSRLFAPLGIRPGQWDTTPLGVEQGANGLHLSARDLARLGYLYLNDGWWDGRRILPAGWVAESTRPAASFDRTRAYGYFIWLWQPLPTFRGRQLNTYFAYGHRGQYIGVYPELDLLVVMSADATDAARETFFVQSYIEDFIRLLVLPAVVERS
jgi:CubicO group peptidase (beta-lactamase class C family)